MKFMFAIFRSSKFAVAKKTCHGCIPNILHPFKFFTNHYSKGKITADAGKYDQGIGFHFIFQIHAFFHNGINYIKIGG